MKTKESEKFIVGYYDEEDFSEETKKKMAKIYKFVEAMKEIAGEEFKSATFKYQRSESKKTGCVMHYYLANIDCNFSSLEDVLKALNRAGIKRKKEDYCIVFHETDICLLSICKIEITDL